jgi:hypothetical protein
MNVQRWIQRSIPVAAAALVGAAPMTQAQYGTYGQQGQSQRGQELFEWTGGVDREVQIVMRGNRVSTNDIGQTEPRNTRARTLSTLPRQDGEVVVQLIDGRGNVDILQQPTAQNGYSTVVRIRDPQSGSDRYRLAAYWQGYSNGDYVWKNGRGRGRGHDKDRDGIDDRDEQYRRRDGQNDQGQYGRNGQYGNQSLLHWTGNIDNEIEIRIQNGRAETRTLSGAQPTSVRVSGGNTTVPRSNAQINVLLNQGRGQISVTQQPTQWNNYTTIVRVRDPQGGYGYYDFDLTWQ